MSKRHVHYGVVVAHQRLMAGFTEIVVDFNNRRPICGISRNTILAPKNHGLQKCKHCIKALALGHNHAKGTMLDITTSIAGWPR